MGGNSQNVSLNVCSLQKGKQIGKKKKKKTIAEVGEGQTRF